MNKITRRAFLKKSALGAGALGLSARSWGQVAGANDDIRIAVVGFNGRGANHISAWEKMKGVRLVALCDVDSNVLAHQVNRAKDQGRPTGGYTDLRKLLANKDIDAISIATPNHWHATATVWGAQAGKDVYVEKPISHNIREGEQMVAAQKRYQKIIQAGTQSRSSHGIKEAVEWVQAGNLGKIRVSRGLCYKRRASIGKTTGPQSIPKSVDYDVWLGPAPLTPPRREKFHYDWHWFWDYGAGDLGNQGVHEMDVARWFLGESAVAPRIMSIGGRLGYEDDAETPNTLIVFQDYAKAPLVMEVRGLPAKAGSKNMDSYKGGQVGIVVECEGGYVLVPDYNSAIVHDNDGKVIKSFKGSTSHFENFIKAVRSRNQNELNAPILEGHLSTALCHTANISYRLGKQQAPDAIREQIKGDKEATTTFQRMTEHVAANGVDMDKTPATLGMMLRMNQADASFVENQDANDLLMRKPREPYIIELT
ncbi:MAG TPA: Gfo/Idh/MocA family oxidoreductase [Verrucomicrobiae bacterium]|jgi:predicted dehydrogenase|nr:Gfo/Idh/MocA family oxidoreductase [Verrucomicrobiae bacterium]